MVTWFHRLHCVPAKPTSHRASTVFFRYLFKNTQMQFNANSHKNQSESLIFYDLFQFKPVGDSNMPFWPFLRHSITLLMYSRWTEYGSNGNSTITPFISIGRSFFNCVCVSISIMYAKKKRRYYWRFYITLLNKLFHMQ